MEITFRTYNGLAGDFHELLIAETDCGIKDSVLFDNPELLEDLKLEIAERTKKEE